MVRSNTVPTHLGASHRATSLECLWSVTSLVTQSMLRLLTVWKTASVWGNKQRNYSGLCKTVEITKEITNKWFVEDSGDHREITVNLVVETVEINREIYR